MAQVLTMLQRPSSLTDAFKALFARPVHCKPATLDQTATAEQVSAAEHKLLYERLIFWEQGQLSETETLAFFQDVVNSGLAWRSTGSVRRTAALLLREGRIRRK
jgi:hypothetical protein